MSLLPSDPLSLMFLGLLTTVWVSVDATRPERQVTGAGKLISRRAWVDIAALSLLNIAVDALFAKQVFTLVERLFEEWTLLPFAALLPATVAVKQLLKRSYTQQVRLTPEGLNVVQPHKQRLFHWSGIEHVSPFGGHSIIQRHGAAPVWLRQYHLACVVDLAQIKPHIKPTLHRRAQLKERSR